MDQSSRLRNNKRAHASSSSYDSQINENSHLKAKLTTSNIGKIRSATNQSCLPPPPDYYGLHLVQLPKPSFSKLNDCNDLNKNLNFRRKFIQTPNIRASSRNENNIDFKHKYADSEPKFLIGWSVYVKRVKIGHEDTNLIIELTGTWITNDYLKVIDKNHNAGILEIIITKNIIKTNNGTYHLIGQIAKGYPDNLYRACLQICGIPKTWKYTLTQFSGKLTGFNKRVIKSESVVNFILHEMLMKGFLLVQRLMEITARKLKEIGKGRKTIPFLRYNFHKKLIFSIQVINDKMIQNLKPVIDED